jgi:SAM-dependent methyltransferase
VLSGPWRGPRNPLEAQPLDGGDARTSRQAREAGARFRRDVRPYLPPDRNVAVLCVGQGPDAAVREQLLLRGYHRTRDAVVAAAAERPAPGVSALRDTDLATALAAEAGGLDVVIAADLLEHLSGDEVREALDAVRRALNAGGVLIARVPNAGSPFRAARGGFTPARLRGFAAAAGLGGIEVHPSGPPRLGPGGTLRWAAWHAAAGAAVLALATVAGRGAGGGAARGTPVAPELVLVARRPAGWAGREAERLDRPRSGRVGLGRLGTGRTRTGRPRGAGRLSAVAGDA